MVEGYLEFDLKPDYLIRRRRKGYGLKSTTLDRMKRFITTMLGVSKAWYRSWIIDNKSKEKAFRA